jgi:hypothetical protein
MSIKQTVSFSQFCDSFSDTYKNNFSYEGKKALYDYLENLSEETGEDIELDTIALCCEYSEYENFEDITKSYEMIETMEDLENHTMVIPLQGKEGLIIQEF